MVRWYHYCFISRLSEWIPIRRMFHFAVSQLNSILLNFFLLLRTYMIIWGWGTLWFHARLEFSYDSDTISKLITMKKIVDIDNNRWALGESWAPGISGNACAWWYVTTIRINSQNWILTFKTVFLNFIRCVV